MRNDDRIAFEDFLERLDGDVGEIVNGRRGSSDKTVNALRQALKHAFCAGIIQGQQKKYNRVFAFGLVTGRRQRK